MQPLVQRLLVVGGNGFIGSAVCKAALARGMQVTSISSSGRPYKTPQGHSPEWTSKVDWRQADALLPEAYADIIPHVGGIVHTIGTLLEGGEYKEKLKSGDLLGLVNSFLGESGNPVDEQRSKGSYETMNRDTALRVCETFISSQNKTTTTCRPFVYISAEDITRPIIPSRYITTKREAELRLEEFMLKTPGLFRGVYVRPSFVYHAHLRPLTSPLAAFIDLSSTIHSKFPKNFPTPSSILRAVGSAFPSSNIPSPLDAMANALTIPPIHLDHVAEAICIALNNPDVSGVVDVQRMRQLIGWREEDAQAI